VLGNWATALFAPLKSGPGSNLLTTLTTVDVWLDAYSLPQCSNCITSTSCGFVVDLVPTIVQQLTRF